MLFVQFALLQNLYNSNNLYNNLYKHIYVTLDHKTSHKGYLFRNHHLLNNKAEFKKPFHWCVVY